MSINPGPFTYKQVLTCIEERSLAEAETEAGLKIMDSVAAKVVMAAYVRKFSAICSHSSQSPREKRSRFDDLFDTKISAEVEHMCAYLLINNLWHDRFE